MFSAFWALRIIELTDRVAWRVLNKHNTAFPDQQQFAGHGVA